MSSYAAWLSWKCQMSSGAAREHIRVARALRDLPVIRGEFARGELIRVGEDGNPCCGPAPGRPTTPRVRG